MTAALDQQCCTCRSVCFCVGVENMADNWNKVGFMYLMWFLFVFVPTGQQIQCDNETTDNVRLSRRRIYNGRHQ